jgi:hypothetical protein
MFLPLSELQLVDAGEGKTRLEGEDAIYVNFGGTERLRLVAVVKECKELCGAETCTHEYNRFAIAADLRPPGGKIKILRDIFEQDFAQEQPAAG